MELQCPVVGETARRAAEGLLETLQPGTESMSSAELGTPFAIATLVPSVDSAAKDLAYLETTLVPLL
jgi:hypothetical protein